MLVLAKFYALFSCLITYFKGSSMKIALFVLLLLSITPSISLPMEAPQELSDNQQEEQPCDNCWSTFIAAFQYSYLKQSLPQGSTIPYAVASATSNMNRQPTKENDFFHDFFAGLASSIAYGHMAQQYPKESNVPFLAASIATGLTKVIKKEKED